VLCVLFGRKLAPIACACADGLEKVVGRGVGRVDAGGRWRGRNEPLDWGRMRQPVGRAAGLGAERVAGSCAATTAQRGSPPLSASSGGESGSAWRGTNACEQMREEDEAVPLQGRSVDPSRGVGEIGLGSLLAI
jgi:hypothetical protein